MAIAIGLLEQTLDVSSDKPSASSYPARRVVSVALSFVKILIVGRSSEDILLMICNFVQYVCAHVCLPLVEKVHRRVRGTFFSLWDRNYVSV